jgi:hypothetical protein
MHEMHNSGYIAKGLPILTRACNSTSATEFGTRRSGPGGLGLIFSLPAGKTAAEMP